MSFRSKLIRAVVISAGAIAITAAFAAMQSAFGCVFFQRDDSMIVAYGLLIGFVAYRARFDTASSSMRCNPNRSRSRS